MNLLQITGSNSSPFFSLILLGGMIVIFYFTMIRPQQMRVRKGKKFIANLKADDPIVTIGGVCGSILTINPDGMTIDMQTSPGVRTTIQKDAISYEWSSRLHKSDATPTLA